MQFKGDCADIPAQFTGMLCVDTDTQCAAVPSPVNDYYCSAFPDDNNPIDSFLVGLIAVGALRAACTHCSLCALRLTACLHASLAAVAMPVTIFLQTAFELSNLITNAPDLWLMFPIGWLTRLIGKEKHKQWHYTRDGEHKVPSRFVRWYIRFYVGAAEPSLITLINLWHRFSAWVRGVPPPWEEDDEIEEAELDRAEVDLTAVDRLNARRHSHVGAEWNEGNSPVEAVATTPKTPRIPRSSTSQWGTRKSVSDGAVDIAADSGEEAVAGARDDLIEKRILGAMGVLGVLVCWAAFAWFTFTCTCCGVRCVLSLLAS